ncbi:MAG: hypothetical protein JKY98_04160 [Gammaproteobacteria bacterium]|nr:hypothetical protein [Gammaproteobacteria bacterium]
MKYILILSMLFLVGCSTAQTIGDIKRIPDRIENAINILQDLELDGLELFIRKARTRLAEKEAAVELNYVRDKAQIKRGWQILGGK